MSIFLWACILGVPVFYIAGFRHFPRSCGGKCQEIPHLCVFLSLLQVFVAVQEQLSQASSLEMPVQCCKWGGGTDELLAKARERRPPLRAWSRAECPPPALPLQPERAKRFLLPSACSGLEPVSWRGEGSQGGVPPVSMTELYLQEDRSSSSPTLYQRPGKQAGVPAGRLLGSPGCNCQRFV